MSSLVGNYLNNKDTTSSIIYYNYDDNKVHLHSAHTGVRRAQSAFRNTGKAQNVESFRPWWIVTKSRAWLMQEKLNLSSWHVDMLIRWKNLWCEVIEVKNRFAISQNASSAALCHLKTTMPALMAGGGEHRSQIGWSRGVNRHCNSKT